MPELLLDTHIWVRFLGGDPSLSAAIVRSVEAAREGGRAFISVISIWEVAMLVGKGRLVLPLSVDVWIERSLQLPGVRLLPFSAAIALETARLPEPMHKDPADRILVATALVETLQLVTLDRAILRFARATNLQHITA